MRFDELARIVSIVTNESFINPTNLADEREKFFNDKSYNPQFAYTTPDYNPDEYLRLLERYLQAPQGGDERISTLVQERVRELMTWVHLVKNRGNYIFTDFSKELFGRPTPRLVVEARRILENLPEAREQEPKTLTAPEARERFLELFKEEGMGDWTVELDPDLPSRVQVKPMERLMRIKEQREFSERDIGKIAVHEIRTHAYRYLQGEKQGHPIFAIGTKGYLETEEGLAMLNEEVHGFRTRRGDERIAGRVLAVYEAQTKSFSQVFQELVKYVDEDLAFHLCVRVKRGLGDTSAPGGFTKDILYLKGSLAVKALPEEDLKYLYAGKVSHVHLPLLKELYQEGKVKLP
ncbi:MAG: tyrosine/phenylalanine carboxypeptidase domain-containing protein [Candidatus Woesearchaeota archaeon]